MTRITPSADRLPEFRAACDDALDVIRSRAGQPPLKNIPVNWARLAIVNVSVASPLHGAATWIVELSGASHDARALSDELQQRLKAKGFESVRVEMDW